MSQIRTDPRHRCTSLILAVFTILTCFAGLAQATPNDQPGRIPDRPFEAGGASVVELTASEASFDQFGVRTWVLSRESSPKAGIAVTQVEGLSEDRELLGSIRIQQDSQNPPSLTAQPPHLRGATAPLREVRKQQWVEAFVRDVGDLQLHGDGLGRVEKLGPNPPNPDICVIKTTAAGVAFAAAVVACSPADAGLACGAAVTALGLALDDMRRACGSGPPPTLCDPGSVAPCSCQYGTCDGPAVGVKICQPNGNGYSSCLGCPNSPPDCTNPAACSPMGIQDSSNWCADNECEGVQGERTCESSLVWGSCTCGDFTPLNECDYEGQTAPQACQGVINCPLGSTATKVCARDPLDSNLAWSDCFCDEPPPGDVEPPHIDDPGPWEDTCPWGPDGCDTVVDERRLCRRCNVMDVATGTCLLWYRWEPC